MRELSVVEIEDISGAGWLQDGLASMGSNAGAAIWAYGSNLDLNLPVVGPIKLSSLAPGLGASASKIGQDIGSTLGGAIESALASVPRIGGILNKLLGN